MLRHAAALVAATLITATASQAQELYFGGGLAYTQGDSTVAVGAPSELEAPMVSLILGQRYATGSGFWGWETNADLSFGAESTFFSGAGTCAANGSDGRPFLCEHQATLRLVGVFGTGVADGTELFGTLGLGALRGGFSDGAFGANSGTAYGPTVSVGLSRDVGNGLMGRGEVIYDSFGNGGGAASSSDYSGTSIRFALLRKF
ncbi:MAG: hypothetical protein JNK19_10210 [Tabrizicola sp.]|nr:hypothetical protein [Tabrizicola sp.]